MRTLPISRAVSASRESKSLQIGAPDTLASDDRAPTAEALGAAPVPEPQAAPSLGPQALNRWGHPGGRGTGQGVATGGLKGRQRNIAE